MDRTFSIIKPDATKRNLTGSINSVIENNGLRIIAQKRIKLTNEQAKKFYFFFCIFIRVRTMYRIFLNI